MSIHAIFTTVDAVKMPLTVFYDYSCVLCRSEIENIKVRDEADVLNLVDCSSIVFDDSQLPIKRDIMMACIHAIDANGKWLKGTDVLVVCYQVAGLNRLSKLFNAIKPLMDTQLYPFVVRHRYRLSALKIHKLLNFMTHRYLKQKANKALKATQSCKEGVCKHL